MIIPQDIIDRLKELNIEEVARKLGLDVNKHRAICFMHNDHRPSLSFSISKNIYTCWVCGKSGGPIHLVQNRMNCSFQDACVWLGEQFNIWRPADLVVSKRWLEKVVRPIAKEHHKVEPENQIDRAIGEWIIEHSVLSSAAKHFLFEERKYKQDVVSSLRIGSLTNPQKLTESLVSLFGMKRCEASGFFYNWRGNLHLCYKAPCLLFPYYDIDGNLYCIQSRFLGSVMDKKDRFKFPKGIRQRLFNSQILNDVKPNEPVYVCEGVTDCIALLSSGKKAVAFPSSSICHPEDIKLLSSSRLFMYPDKDEAGEGLYKRLSDGLKPFSNVVHRVDLPEGFHDFSDYYLSLQ